MKDRSYILTTKFSDCLNRLVETGRFYSIRRAQPDSGPFLDEIAALPQHQRPTVQFVLFDRVPGSDTFRKLKTVYALEDVVEEGEVYKGQQQHTLVLRKVQDMDPALPFGQGTKLWKALTTTSGKKTTTFYNSGRMLLPIPLEDFETILEFRTPADALSTEDEDEGSAPLATHGGGVALVVESELHAYLAENLDIIESDLEPYDPGDYVERQTDDGGRIDLLCRDARGDIVVVELKKGRADDKVIGQLARYMGWAKEKLTGDGASVRGIIVANVASEKLRLAAKAFPDVRLVSYEVKFTLRTIN